jgi:hypothetical protein
LDCDWEEWVGKRDASCVSMTKGMGINLEGFGTLRVMNTKNSLISERVT